MQFVSLKSFEEVIPTALVERLAVEHKVDRCNQVRLPGQAVFSCLVHAILTDRMATQRALEDIYYKQTGGTADHSSFGKRLAKIPVAFFRSIYEHLYDVLAPTATMGEIKALRVRYVDATIVTLSARLIGFGLLRSHTGQSRTGAPYRALKAVFSLDQDNLPQFLRLSKSAEESGDVIALGRAIETSMRPNELLVFDAGCHDRHRLLSIHKHSAFFLTPHSTQKLHVQRVVLQVTSDELVQRAPQKADPTYQLVRVEECRFGNNADKKAFVELPLVVIHGLRWDARSKLWRPLVLMTNLPLCDNDNKAGPYTFVEVAATYRSRWDIEIFFKFIKQHLGYSHIISRTENGLEVMIYMTLITALLMLWYKRLTKNKNGWPSVKRFMRDDAALWTKELMETAIWIQLNSRKNKQLRI